MFHYSFTVVKDQGPETILEHKNRKKNDGIWQLKSCDTKRKRGCFVNMNEYLENYLGRKTIKFNTQYNPIA